MEIKRLQLKDLNLSEKSFIKQAEKLSNKWEEDLNKAIKNKVLFFDLNDIDKIENKDIERKALDLFQKKFSNFIFQTYYDNKKKIRVFLVEKKDIPMIKEIILETEYIYSSLDILQFIFEDAKNLIQQYTNLEEYDRVKDEFFYRITKRFNDIVFQRVDKLEVYGNDYLNFT